MSTENDSLFSSLKKVMGGIQKQAQNEAPESPTDPVVEMRKSVSLIRTSMPKAKLGDKTASSRIMSELDAIERALSRASKFNRM